MINIKLDRLKCAYCFTIDAMAFVFTVYSLLNPIYFNVAAFLDGFAVVGMGYEALFQAEHYNFFTLKTMERLQALYIFVIAAIFTALFLHGIAAPFLFLGAVLYMQFLNMKRYAVESPMIYDMYIFVPVMLGSLIIFYI